MKKLLIEINLEIIHVKSPPLFLFGPADPGFIKHSAKLSAHMRLEKVLYAFLATICAAKAVLAAGERHKVYNRIREFIERRLASCRWRTEYSLEITYELAPPCISISEV